MVDKSGPGGLDDWEVKIADFGVLLGKDAKNSRVTLNLLKGAKISMQQLVDDFAEALRMIDDSQEPYKTYHPGVGPYGEPQLVKKALSILRSRYPERYRDAKTKREPDVVIPNRWAVECKIVRPFGNNGIEAEHWSQNLLHPYAGNVSAIGDAMKLLSSARSERKGLIVFAFEHSPPKIDVEVLVEAFELVSRDLLKIPLGLRYVALLDGLRHPVHQQARVFGWELRTVT